MVQTDARAESCILEFGLFAQREITWWSSSRGSWWSTGLVGIQLFYAGGPPLLGEHVLLGCSACNCFRRVVSGNSLRERDPGREFREILFKNWVISVTKKFREIWVTNMGITGVMPLPAAGEETLQPGCLEPGSSCFFREIT